MLKINTLIVDDEQPAIEELHYHCSQFIDPQNIYDQPNPKKVINTIKDMEIQLIFLDINMPYMSGIKLASQIIKLAKPPHIIFVTAYDEYALKAFELNAIDYILKPIEKQRFKNTIEKIKNIINSPSNKNNIEQTENFLNHKITAVGTNPNDRYIFDLKNITHFSAEGPLVFAHTLKDKKRVHYQLQQLENALPSNFTRSHKSHIVNLEYVTRMYLWKKSSYMIELQNGIQIPVSRRLCQQVKEKLNW